MNAPAEHTNRTASASGAETVRVPGRVWRSTLLLIAGRVVSTGLSFVALGVLARTLGGAEFGRLTFYLAVFLFLEAFVDSGTSTAALQQGAHDTRRLADAIRSGRRIRCVAAAFAWVAVVATAWLFREPDLAWIVLAGLIPFTRALELSTIVYNNEIAWRVPVFVRASVAALRLICVLVLWNAGVRSVGPYLFAHVLCGGAGNVVLHVLARSKIVARSDRGSSLWRAALPLAAAGIAQHAYFYADNLVIRSQLGETELGLYNAAVRILTFLIMTAGFATSAALPWLTRRCRQGELGRATMRLALPMFAVTSVVLACVGPLADELLTILFGARFAEAATSLRWLLLAAAIIYGGAGLLTAVIAARRSGAFLVIVTCGLALNVAGNLWLVPELGIEGAAIATVATELFVALASLGVLAGARPTDPAVGPVDSSNSSDSGTSPDPSRLEGC